jgi:hypothetical protein
MLDKKHIWLLGILAFGVFVYINSNNKLEMVEVEEPKESDKKSFDSSTLPLILTPPTRLSDGETIPATKIKKNFTSIFNLKPRLDRKANNFI